MAVLLGCIGDDFTGSTDLANTLVCNGMRTVQLIGVPPTDLGNLRADAVVIALKSRSVPASEAVEQSLQALNWLNGAGSRQIFFKYCSTFDSTDEGNIGPVAEALLDALGSDFTIACPAFPTNARTVYKGHLFVGDVPLSESGMRDHPLTPMTDANLVRVLGRQTSGSVGLVQHSVVCRGTEAIHEFFQVLRQGGCRHAIVDALYDEDLLAIGGACAGMPLVTGGSGVAMGLPENFRREGVIGATVAPALPRIKGPAAVLSGSCSEATREQVASMEDTCSSFALDPIAMAAGEDVVGKAVAWARGVLGQGPALIYSTAAPAQISEIQTALGKDRAGALIEDAMARIAVDLVGHGVGRLIVAGGETAGAVVTALGIGALRIGPEIDPGVPWTESIGNPKLALALKSGNFGDRDFFLKALDMLT